jgi:uncharacterized membrane protein YfcA
MSPLVFTLLAFVISIAAGFVGSLLGLGGGIIVIPALTLLLHVNIRFAIGASIVSVIATSSGAAVAYVRDHISNLRVAMFLEIATTTGAISGAYLSGHISVAALYFVFGAVMALSALQMLRQHEHNSTDPVPPDRIADKLRLHDSYYDPATSQVVHYRVTHSGFGLLLMYMAGAISGLLGVGSGALKVLAMDLAMRLPIKVSSATSNFMIGVTAAASAGVYFARGDINPFIAAPVAAGVLGGALAGSHLLGRISSARVRGFFIVVLLVIAIEMLYKGYAAW